MDSREQLVRSLMGTVVHVEVDRPIGHRHNNTVYPINYGYIPGVIVGDGEAQDAYILGVEKPVSSFDGRVIAVIRRKNDCEDKLVVAPEGMCFHQAQIAEAVHFQEQYFTSTVDSLFRKSCGVIPFRRNGRETELQTALRELAEETGLQATLIPDAKTVLEYHIPPLTQKQVVLFLGEVHGNIALQEKEIAGCRWAKPQQLQALLHPDTYAACADLIAGLSKEET